MSSKSSKNKNLQVKRKGSSPRKSDQNVPGKEKENSKVSTNERGEKNVSVNEKGEKILKCGYIRTKNSNILSENSLPNNKGIRAFKCSECDYVSNRNGNLTAHVRAIHKRAKRYECTHCSYKTAYKNVLEGHIRTHTGEKPFKCDWKHCNYRSRKKSNLELHKKIHFNKVTDKHQVKDSESVIESKGSMQDLTHSEVEVTCDHSHIEAEVDAIISSCPDSPISESSDDSCGLSLFTEGKNAELDKRSPNVSQDKQYKCADCIYKTTYLKDFNDHRRTHSDEKPYKCRYCKFRSTQKSNVLSHERRHTKANKSRLKQTKIKFVRSPVKEPAKQLPGPNNETFKLSSNEDGKKIYKCNFCVYECIWQSDILRHVRVHTGEKPFKCSDCNYASGDISALNRHSRIHSGSKIFKSKNCNFSTGDKTTLKNHLVTHFDKNILPIQK